MTLFLDTSALLRRHLRDRHRPLVLETMEADDQWCVSALARTELLVALHRLSLDPYQQRGFWDAVRAEWDAYWIVPVDDRCLARAVEIAARFSLRTVDAIHLAAADRLPERTRYLTFERHQLPAAAELGFEVVTPLEV